MKVTVVGTGYVGLVTGACLAEMGNHVVCLDVDESKIRALDAGRLPIHEPGLKEIVERNVAAHRLQFTTDVPLAVNHGTLQFIGVGTPPDEDGSADLQYVLAAARNIGRHMTDYKVVIDKSTVPVVAGAGYGGSCFTKDVKALVRMGSRSSVDMMVLKAVDEANERQKHVLVDKVIARFGHSLRGRRFAVWGLAFKPDTDDMRGAPSRVVIEQLAELGAVVYAYDPAAADEARRVLGSVESLRIVADAASAIEGADALLILTEWKEFKSPDFERMRKLLKQAVVFDGRNLYDPELMAALGIEYIGIGRGATCRAPADTG